jgi:hypothetical protein
MRVTVAAGGPEFGAAVVRRTLGIGVLASALALAGCVSVPTSPSTMALPGSTKGFDQFQHDDGACRQYAYDAVGGNTATAAQQDSAVRSALAGAVIGALIGGAINGGHGAAVGAGVGGAAGGIAGVGASEYSAHEAQRRYDQAYTQCMYAAPAAAGLRLSASASTARLRLPAALMGYAALNPSCELFFYLVASFSNACSRSASRSAGSSRPI